MMLETEHDRPNRAIGGGYRQCTIAQAHSYYTQKLSSTLKLLCPHFERPIVAEGTQNFPKVHYQASTNNRTFPNPPLFFSNSETFHIEQFSDDPAIKILSC